MKNVRIVTFLVVVFTFCNCCFSQKIDCSYNLEICPTKQLKDTDYYRLIYFAKINANIKIIDFKDTCLELSTRLWAEKLGINEVSLKIFYFPDKEMSQNDYSYNFKNGVLSIHFRKNCRNFSIKCMYNYMGSTFVTIPESNKRDIIIFGGEENFEYFASMFFTSNKYLLTNKTLKITAPKSKYILSSDYPIYEDIVKNNYLFKLNNDSTKLVNSIITILDTMSYKKIKLSNLNKSYEFYVRKNHLDSFYLALKDIEVTINLVNDYKSNNYNKSKINFVEFDWQRDQYAMGRGFDNLVMYDWSFFTKHKVSFIHEFLHTQLNPKSNGNYFVNESLIEYIANYFCFFNDKNRFLSEIKKKHENFIESTKASVDKTSLYALEENNVNTFSLIYDEGPVILNDFAKKIGEDRFVKLSILFFSKMKKVKKNKYEFFLKFLHENKVNKKYIFELDQKVKSIV